jgi:hypothetical protein
MLMASPPSRAWLTVSISGRRPGVSLKAARQISEICGLPADTCKAMLQNGYIFLEYPPPFKKWAWEKIPEIMDDNQHDVDANTHWRIDATPSGSLTPEALFWKDR